MYGFPHHYGLQHAFPQPPPPPGHRQLQRCASDSWQNFPKRHLNSPTNTFTSSLDVQLDIRQQPKEALVTTDGKEKGK
jgi:hypothetical protein